MDDDYEDRLRDLASTWSWRFRKRGVDGMNPRHLYARKSPPFSHWLDADRRYRVRAHGLRPFGRGPPSSTLRRTYPVIFKLRDC